MGPGIVGSRPRAPVGTCFQLAERRGNVEEMRGRNWLYLPLREGLEESGPVSGIVQKKQ